MKPADRKAAISAYKERKVAAGLYRISCTASGQQWVGRAADLGTVWNRQQFALRMGSNPHRSLQEAWTRHGGECFSFEEIERLKEPASDGLRDAQLRNRLSSWCERLGAEPI